MDPDAIWMALKLQPQASEWISLCEKLLCTHVPLLAECVDELLPHRTGGRADQEVVNIHHQ